MPASSAKIIQDDTRTLIIEAAEQRFQQYGYNKTTMAEIAGDTSMSAANLYRFFKSKEDIAAACCGNSMTERVQRLREAIRAPGLSAAERLESYIITTLQVSYEMAMENTKIHELITTITENRADLVHRKIQSENALIAEILAYGNETGEFKIDDVIATASTIHSTLVVFDVPLFMGLFSYEEFEQKARSVAELLINGLR